jgi:hypothetical protein
MGFEVSRTFLILNAEICEGKNTEEKEQDEGKERKNRRRLRRIEGGREMGQEQENNEKKGLGNEVRKEGTEGRMGDKK